MYVLFLIIVGILSGITASMGLGGGFILLICFSLFTGFSQLENQFINLLFFIPISILSLIIHCKNNLVEKSVLLKSILFGVVGVIIGSFTATFINQSLLRQLFGFLVIFVGIKQLISIKKNSKNNKSK